MVSFHWDKRFEIGRRGSESSGFPQAASLPSSFADENHMAILLCLKCPAIDRRRLFFNNPTQSSRAQKKSQDPQVFIKQSPSTGALNDVSSVSHALNSSQAPQIVNQPF